MKKAAAIIIVLSLLLSGCSSWMNGSYIAVAPHTEPSTQKEKPTINVSTDVQLQNALITLVDSGEENGVIYLQDALRETIDENLETIVKEVTEKHPFAVYAVEEIQCEIGAVGGKDAVSVHITYQQNRQHRDKIRRVENLEQIKKIILERLEACEPGVVMVLDHQVTVDFPQLVADCAMEYPQKVMEMPEVAVSYYPEEGDEQIVEVKFTYWSSREELRTNTVCNSGISKPSVKS